MKAAYSPPKNIVRWRNVGSLFIIICFRILSWHWACKSLTVFPAGGYKSAHWWSLMAPVPESVMRLIYKPVLICVGIRCSGPKIWLFVIQMSGRNHFGRTSSNKLGRVYYLLYFLWIRFDEWNDGRFARFIRLNAFSSKAMIKCAWQVFWLVSVVDAFPEECSSGIEGDCLQHCAKLTAAGLFRIYTWFPFNRFPWRGGANQCMTKIGILFEKTILWVINFLPRSLSFCRQVGKVLPPSWQDFAALLAKLCHSHGKSLPKAWW